MIIIYNAVAVGGPTQDLCYAKTHKETALGLKHLVLGLDPANIYAHASLYACEKCHLSQWGSTWAQGSAN